MEAACFLVLRGEHAGGTSLARRPRVALSEASPGVGNPNKGVPRSIEKVPESMLDAVFEMREGPGRGGGS